VLQNFDWDWKGADAALQKAITLDPGNAEVMRTLGKQLGIVGREEEALDLLRKAVALDPLNATGHRLLGLRCAMFGRYREAVAAMRAALDLNPKSGLVHAFMASVRLQEGDALDALGWAKREVLPDFRQLAIALVEHTLGHAAESDAALVRLIEDYGNYAAYQIAEVFSWRGEKDRAFEWLERAYAQRDPGLGNCLTDPYLKALHGDPRWPPFLRKMGLA